MRNPCRLAIVTVLCCAAAQGGSVIPIYWGASDHGSAWLPLPGNESWIQGSWFSPPITRYSFNYWVSTGGLGCIGGDMFCGAQNFRWHNSNPYSAHVIYDAYWAVFGGVHVDLQILGEIQPTWTAPPSTPWDTQAPSTTATVGATAATNPGWYETDGAVGLSAVDPVGGSGVAPNGTLYRLPGDSTWRTYAAPIDFAGEGAHTLNYLSYDAAGNAGTEEVLTFSVDYSPPVLSGLTPNRTYSQYYDFDMQSWAFQVHGKITDTLARGAQLSFYLDQPALSNVSGCAANTPNATTGDFTMKCGVIDPQYKAAVTFGWADQAGHLTTAAVETDVPEPAPWMLTLPAAGALLWHKRRRG